jgi:hypothetical protein
MAPSPPFFIKVVNRGFIHMLQKNVSRCWNGDNKDVEGRERDFF